ncbi:uncharacterized protein CDV56_100649 [Aspergillus thermomutatus]|uniref:Uncharacterized protein n=1 Tax=Aspergillus thermomutatus TaxID=41047 RepID=A0A397G7J2_ASPTH|nr:uncharacterized protein CDV56_100649 [Aspergillus thermomutatus]RHZ44070.1 hypothetical protein CDV56_100649 [Aspergillus thermomutatus]
MSSVSSVLIRRGTELISARLRYREQSQMHDWLGLSIVIFTALAFGLAIFWVDYTCTHVIATLAAVEDSNPKTYVRLDSEDPNDSFDPTDTEVAAASTPKPITSGLRSTIKHLRARGGIWSCFRGFRMYLAFTGFDMGVGFLVRAIVPIPIDSHSLAGSFFGSFFGEFVASMLLATWQMAWVHLVIADKSPRSSYRRMLGLRHWPRIAPAAALYNFLTCATFSLPTAAAGPAGWAVMAVVTNRGYKGLLGFLAISILPAVFFLLVSVPARGIFTRVAASMLPEEDDPIVPFDRLFGGKVKPEVVGGSGKLGLRDAWTTFDWAARARYVKVILKALAIEVALGVVGILLIIGELTLVTPTSQSSASHS